MSTGPSDEGADPAALAGVPGPAGNSLEARVRAFVVRELMLGQDDIGLKDDTDLVENRILDSLDVLRLVDFLEQEFDISLESHELFQLTTIAGIAGLVRAKGGR